MSTGGYSTKVVKEVFKRLNIKVELPIQPWKRCVSMVEHGTMDGMNSCMYSKEREGYLSVTDPWVIGKGVWYYINKKFPQGFEWDNYDDFKGFKVVGVLGYAYGEEVLAAEKRGALEIHRTTNSTLAVKQLAAGRHDFFLEFNIAGDHIFNQNGLENKFSSPRKPLYVNAQRICISKKSQFHDLIPEINDKLSEMKAEGVIEDILKGSP